MKLKVTGMGVFTRADFEASKIPYKRYIPKSLRRSTERLAQFFYIASMKALVDAGIDTEIDANNTFPLVSATSMSEMDGTIDFFEQIHSSKGKLVSPKKFQNIVMNAPASLLSIGLGIKLPVITISNSLLSIEDALSYAKVLFNTGAYSKILVVGGEIFLERWHELLEKHHRSDLAEKLKSQGLEEGAVAIVISNEDEPKKQYFEILNSAVIRLSNSKTLSLDILKKYDFNIGKDTLLIIKKYCMDNISEAMLSERLGIDKSRIKLSSNSLANPLYDISNLVKEEAVNDVLFIGNDADNYGLLHVKF